MCERRGQSLNGGRIAVTTIEERACRPWARAALAALCTTLALLAPGTPAGADDFGSRGDAQADLKAFGNGGWAILNHSPSGLGAPADVDIRFEIRPGDFFDGRHYCVEDWHVILIAWVEGGDASFSRNDAYPLLSSVRLSFVLDGAPLVTTRGPIKPWLYPQYFGWETAYYFQEGRIMSPAELGVGGHELELSAFAAGELVYQFQITFIVDPPGTGACL
jgi:hypothetical protein